MTEYRLVKPPRNLKPHSKQFATRMERKNDYKVKSKGFLSFADWMPQKQSVRKRYRIKSVKIKHAVKKSKTKEICHYIQTQQWEKLVPFVDELISQINRGSVSLTSVSKLLESTTQDYEIMQNNLFMREIVKTITILLKEVMIFMVSDKTVEALSHAKRIRTILLTAQEISMTASEEGLSPLPVSNVSQIDMVEGRPIYALK